MLRVANGTVDLETIESLSLLSYSSFIGMLGYSEGIVVNDAHTNRK